MVTTDDNDTPRVWVGCLAAYNNGKLHGKWVDAVDADDLQTGIDAVLSSSPEPDAEEWFFADNENFYGSIGEGGCADEIANWGALIEKHGQAIAEFVSHFGKSFSDDGIEAKFEDSFHGEWDSSKAYAEDYLQDAGVLDAIPENLQRYFDVEKYAREMFMNGYIEIDSPRGIFVFSSY